MTRQLLVAFAAVSLSTPALAQVQDEPTFKTTLTYHELVLPATMRRVLDEHLPGFRPWRLSDYSSDIQQYYSFSTRQAPWAVIGDFNGDQLLDVVIDGHDDRRSYRVCLMSSPGTASFVVLTLATDAYHPTSERGSVLLYQGPGLVGTNFDESTVRLEMDAFHDYYFEKAGTLFYWLGDHFDEFTSSD